MFHIKQLYTLYSGAYIYGHGGCTCTRVCKSSEDNDLRFSGLVTSAVTC